MKMHFAIAFACGASSAYIQDADPPDALGMLLLAGSRAPVRSAAPQSKLMNRRQTAAGLLSVIAAGIASPAFAGAEQDYIFAYQESGLKINGLRAYWEQLLPKQIEKGEWEAIAEYMRFPVEGGTREEKRGGTAFKARLALSSYICVKSKPTSKLCLQGNKYVQDLSDACKMLVNAAKGKVEEDGFVPFTKNAKQMDAQAQKALALEAYEKGKQAITNYINLSNAREFFPELDQFDDGSKKKGLFSRFKEDSAEKPTTPPPSAEDLEASILGN